MRSPRRDNDSVPLIEDLRFTIHFSDQLTGKKDQRLIALGVDAGRSAARLARIECHDRRLAPLRGFENRET